MFLYQCKSKDTSHEEAFASPVHLVTPIHLIVDNNYMKKMVKVMMLTILTISTIFTIPTFTEVLFSDGVFGPQPSPSITWTKTSVG